MHGFIKLYLVVTLVTFFNPLLAGVQHQQDELLDPLTGCLCSGGLVSIGRHPYCTAEPEQEPEQRGLATSKEGRRECNIKRDAVNTL